MVDNVLTSEGLDTLKQARAILAETYCAWWADHPDGVRHCASGAIVKALGGDRARWILLMGALNCSALALHPELAGQAQGREENGLCNDYFDDYPAVFVNNHLGREAILQVFDAAILEAEIRLAAAPIPEPVEEPEPERREAAVAR